MKIRGQQKDIKRFFREGIDPSYWAGEVNELNDQVIDESNDDELEFTFKDEPHIKGTRRAFITDSYVYMGDDVGVVCVDVKQAWAFDAGRDTEDLEKWKNISDSYNIDIRLFGIECGMQFTQEIIIIKGKRPIVNEKQYENWEWECPFPNMGG